MRIPPSVVNIVCAIATPIYSFNFPDIVQTMTPWLITMTAVVLCDLTFGIRKSVKLGIHVSPSLAFRETMGKLVVYYAFVLTVSCVEWASGHSYKIAMWACLFVCAIEGLSIIGNLLKPYGITFSLRAFLTFAASKVMKIEQPEAEVLIKGDDNMEHIKDAEKSRWERRDKQQYGGKAEKEEGSV